MPGIVVYFDDILIAAASEQEQDKILNEVIQTARKLNAKFYKSKIQFKVPEVKFLGHVINKNGICPDVVGTKAISRLIEPKTKKELQRLLGLINNFF